MLLLALQTTAAVSDDRRIDAITLVLVVIFLVSMAALSLLFFRRNGADAIEPPAATPLPDLIQARAPYSSPTRRVERLPTTPDFVPAWLQGVNISGGDASLTEAAQIIAALLAARRNHDLAGGLGLYSTEMLESFRSRLGVDEAGFADVLDQAQFDGEPPTLRSLDLIGGTTNRMTVRAGYTNGASEVYRLIRLDGQWLIEGIAPS